MKKLSSAPTRAKRELIELAWEKYHFHSFADLGGVGSKAAAYTFSSLENYPIDRAVLVDTRLQEDVREKASRHPNLLLVDKNFGDGPAL